MNMFRWTSLALALALLAGGWLAIGADLPATQPATQPDTQPASQPTTLPHTAELPNGFHKLTAGSVTVFCLPADDAWLQPVLKDIRPASRPSTMPADVQAAFTAQRAAVVKQLAADLAMTDEKPLNDFLDKEYVSAMAKIVKVAELKFNLYYLPMTYKQLTGIMKAGWSDPRYRYTPLGTVRYDEGINLNIDHPMDDIVMWIRLKEDSTDAEKAATVKGFIEDHQNDYLNYLSEQGQTMSLNVLRGLVREQAIKPLKLPAALEWVGEGISLELGMKYAALLSNRDRFAAMDLLLHDNPQNPLPAREFDLLDPLDASVLQPQYAEIYRGCVLRKGAMVIHQLVKKTGDESVPKLLTALRGSTPANARDFVKLVKSAIGVDLTENLKPDYSPLRR